MNIDYQKVQEKIRNMEVDVKELLGEIVRMLEKEGDSSVDKVEINAVMTVIGKDKFRICIGRPGAPGTVCIEL
ncbi:hypothetical protein A9404_01770 [Halothiobacillus diazotrophicus]|uniref:Uncharacterized protein n=1 Tax=Halothiobacillus diazotrophicus TaxID=1860122 RepID=A0A191ZEH7_9GAMM|nr:hypothetical protein [Halothiobacillus diazotrophicus]ANJ66272.1 hypothetical protein A9404_01770 [Halothiobacillus diazotrophicus]